MVLWLKEQGMKGLVAYDLAVVETPGSEEALDNVKHVHTVHRHLESTHRALEQDRDVMVTGGLALQAV